MRKERSYIVVRNNITLYLGRGHIAYFVNAVYNSFDWNRTPSVIEREIIEHFEHEVTPYVYRDMVVTGYTDEIIRR